jgi:uncharacterized protein (TIGR02611 family)
LGTNQVATPSDGRIKGAAAGPSAKVIDMPNGQHPASRRNPHPPRDDQTVADSPDTGRSPQAAAATMAGSRPPRPTYRRRIHDTLEVIRANPTGRVALKVFVAVLGALVVAVGIVLIPLPGPGWALVILGLAIWGVEFVWAKHLLRFTRRQVHKWTRWIGKQSLPVRFVLGAVGLLFVGGVVWLSVKVGFRIDLIAVCWKFLVTH